MLRPLCFRSSLSIVVFIGDKTEHDPSDKIRVKFPGVQTLALTLNGDCSKSLINVMSRNRHLTGRIPVIQMEFNPNESRRMPNYPEEDVVSDLVLYARSTNTVIRRGRRRCRGDLEESWTSVNVWTMQTQLYLAIQT